MTKSYQYLVARSESNVLTYYLTCIPDRREEGKWIAARYPLMPLRTLVNELDDPIHRLFQAGVAEEGVRRLAHWRVLNFEEFLALPANRAFAKRKS